MENVCTKTKIFHSPCIRRRIFRCFPSTCVYREVFLHITSSNPSTSTSHISKEDEKSSLRKREKSEKRFLMYAEIDVARWRRTTRNETFECGNFFQWILVYFYFAPLLCKKIPWSRNEEKNSLMFSFERGRRRSRWRDGVEVVLLKRPIHTHYYNLNLNLTLSTSKSFLVFETANKRKEAWNTIWSWTRIVPETFQKRFYWFIIYLSPELEECIQSWCYRTKQKTRRKIKEKGRKIRNLETILTPKRNKTRIRMSHEQYRKYRHRWEFKNASEKYDLLLLKRNFKTLKLEIFSELFWFKLQIKKRILRVKSPGRVQKPSIKMFHNQWTRLWWKLIKLCLIRTKHSSLKLVFVSKCLRFKSSSTPPKGDSRGPLTINLSLVITKLHPLNFLASLTFSQSQRKKHLRTFPSTAILTTTTNSPFANEYLKP